MNVSVRKIMAGLVAAGALGTLILPPQATAQDGEWAEADQLALADVDDSDSADVTISDPLIGRYTTTEGGRAFILDQSRQKARLRFARSPEILTLDMVPGPQGATYFKDEFGHTLLRLMPWGGITLYDADGNEGHAYGREKDAAPLARKERGVTFLRERSREIEDGLNTNQRLKLSFTFEPSIAVIKAKADLEAAEERLAEAEAREAVRQEKARAKSLATMTQEEFQESRMERKPLSLASGAYSASDNAAPSAEEKKKPATAVVDAVEVFYVAMRRLTRDDLARETLAEELSEVVFRAAEHPSIELYEGRLVITYAPDKGLEGRPSSAAIERYLLENL